jgi:hypothetical protein
MIILAFPPVLTLRADMMTDGLQSEGFQNCQSCVA